MGTEATMNILTKWVAWKEEHQQRGQENVWKHG